MRTHQPAMANLAGAAALAVTLVWMQASLLGEEGDKKPAPTPRQDAFVGKTVKNSKHGMGLIRARGRNVPKVGQVAPDFTLERADGKGSIKLSSFRGLRPVVLVFGSFT